MKDWEEKVLHGQYLQQTKEVRSDQCWAWLQNARTNLVKAKIDKSQRDSLRKMCRKVDESIVSGCSKLAQKE